MCVCGCSLKGLTSRYRHAGIMSHARGAVRVRYLTPGRVKRYYARARMVEGFLSRFLGRGGGGIEEDDGKRRGPGERCEEGVLWD